MKTTNLGNIRRLRSIAFVTGIAAFAAIGCQRSSSLGNPVDLVPGPGGIPLEANCLLQRSIDNSDPCQDLPPTLEGQKNDPMPVTSEAVLWDPASFPMKNVCGRLGPDLCERLLGISAREPKSHCYSLFLRGARKEAVRLGCASKPVPTPGDRALCDALRRQSHKAFGAYRSYCTRDSQCTSLSGKGVLWCSNSGFFVLKSRYAEAAALRDRYVQDYLACLERSPYEEESLNPAFTGLCSGPPVKGYGCDKARNVCNVWVTHRLPDRD